MSTDAASGSPPVYDPVPREEQLLRLNFSPEHIQNGEVIPNAIAVEDLKKRGYSLDREHLVKIETIQKRSDSQSAKNPKDREESYISRFGCESVCLEVDDEGAPAFKVEASPREDNNAHAHILSAISRGPGTLRKLRGQLVPHLNRELIRFRDYAARSVKS